MKDRLGVEIEPGCTIAYPGRASSSVWCSTAMVIEVHPDRLVVVGGDNGANFRGRVKELGQRTIRCLDHVLVTAGRVAS